MPRACRRCTMAAILALRTCLLPKNRRSLPPGCKMTMCAIGHGSVEAATHASGDIAIHARISDMRIDALLTQQSLQHGRIGVLLTDAEAGGVAGDDGHDVKRPGLQRSGGEHEDGGNDASA